MTTLVLRRASLRPGQEGDLVLADGRVQVGPADAALVGGADVDVIDLAGRPVVPGLVDHHLHLLALAAAWDSVDLSPTALQEGGGLDAVLQGARRRQPQGWLRGVGYDVAASGPLDAARLARTGTGPLRIQDRTGIQWVLDPIALAEVLPTDPAAWPSGVDLDVDGRPSGVLVRLDAWLRGRWPEGPPDVAAVGRWLAERGVTSVTDAGAANGPVELALLAGAGLDQHVTAMTRDAQVEPVPGIALGPVKVLLDDADLPALDDLSARIEAAHRVGRTVAVHCVTEVQLVLALAAGLDQHVTAMTRD
ncbi:MAG TPA: amidohydrolase family protein, partial [Acidimicrobiales bacterium]